MRAPRTDPRLPRELGHVISSLSEGSGAHPQSLELASATGASEEAVPEAMEVARATSPRRSDAGAEGQPEGLSGFRGFTRFDGVDDR